MHPLVAAILAGAGGGPRITVEDRTANGNNTDPGTATAGYRLEDDGDVLTQGTPSSFSDVGDWIAPKTLAGSDWEARMTKQSGNATLAQGSEATWESLGTTRTYLIQQVGAGSADYVGLIEIRRSGGSVAGSATITLNAVVTL